MLRIVSRRLKFVNAKKLSNRLSMMLDIIELMESLSRCRPIFHLEADFQHALACYIHNKMPDCQVRLEFKPFKNDGIYLDIWLRVMGIAIELKYKTKELDLELAGEFFTLSNQNAQDLGRYEFINDILRLERVVTKFGPAKTGVAVLLTNDPCYWNPSSPDRQDAAFHLDEGKKIKGAAWADGAKLENKGGKEKQILLEGSYDCVWRDYSCLDLPDGNSQQFRYLMVKVPCSET